MNEPRRRPLIGTSWKMNLTASQAVQYLDVLVPLVADVHDRDLFILPPFTAIHVARNRLRGTNVAWGGQDVHPEDWGAHTGDVSAPMLADLGAQYVEVGHAERRRDHGETPETIAAKAAAAVRWGMTPVVCVGEPFPVGPAAALRHVLPDLERLLARLDALDLGRIVIAYEPIWAIGETGSHAAPQDVGVVHRGIHDWLAARGTGGANVRVIYGGSVDLEVATDLLRESGVDGLFVGRAALSPHGFAAIAHAALATGAVMQPSGTRQSSQGRRSNVAESAGPTD